MRNTYNFKCLKPNLELETIWNFEIETQALTAYSVF